ncbi:MAG: precorrin-3B C(17)-methyltransferase [Clostridiales bacterium]|nr:precorrin-3B C(17)-methyltransferase [Clostridiales bacterium]
MLYVVGIGPGNKEEMTAHALNAICKSDTIVGYKTYIDLVKEHISEKEVVVNGMRGEVERCTRAVELASEGKNVAVISSGDPGVYAMSGLVLEIVAAKELDLDIEIVPGITSANGASASLGAPIMHDHAYISLSDLLTDFELIKKRLSLAAEGDFVICLFNPKSKGRPAHIDKAREILLKHKSVDTVVGIVNNAKREGEKVTITTLGKMLEHHIDMTTMVVIGNSNTYKYKDFMITPRGYQV